MSLQDIANEQLNHIDITLQDAIDQLATLDINKSYGPDSIGPKVLKNISNSIAPSLLKLFHTNFTNGAKYLEMCQCAAHLQEGWQI